MIKIDDQCYVELFQNKGEVFIKVRNHYLDHIATVMTFPSSTTLDDAIKRFKNETKQA